MLPPSARGRTLCGFGIVLLLAPVLFPPPPTRQRGALGCWRSRPAATPLRAAALLRLASGPCLCFHTRPYPCLLACPPLSASGAVVFPPACNMGRVAVSRPPPPTVSSSSSREPCCCCDKLGTVKAIEGGACLS